MMRRFLAAAVSLFVLCTGTACSVSDTLRSPTCTDSSSSVLIAGQSVPSASLLVCFDPLPAGWEVGNVHIGSDGTSMVFHSDRAGGSAARFRYAASCELGAATSTPTEYARTNRFEWILEVEPRFRANRYYQFDGGCVTWEFDFDPETPAAMSVELGSALQFVDRESVNADMREFFVDEDL